MKPVLLELRQLHPQVTDVHFLLDGPTVQEQTELLFTVNTDLPGGR